MFSLSVPICKGEMCLIAQMSLSKDRCISKILSFKTIEDHPFDWWQPMKHAICSVCSVQKDVVWFHSLNWTMTAMISKKRLVVPYTLHTEKWQLQLQNSRKGIIYFESVSEFIVSNSCAVFTFWEACQVPFCLKVRTTMFIKLANKTTATEGERNPKKYFLYFMEHLYY